jgi:uncharacterized protein (DUF302 family)
MKEMKKLLTVLAVMGMFIQPVYAGEGVISIKSAHNVMTTSSRFEQIIRKKGLTLFAHVSHSDGAVKAGLELRPTELVIFGNPKVGTPLMQCAQQAAIDLPQKMLIWQDESELTWLSYNDPRYLAKRHHITGCDASIKKIGAVLDKLAHAAAGREQ